VPHGAITLADVAVRTDELVVACTRCERAGQYSVKALVRHYGRRRGVPDLLRLLSADCPRALSVSGCDMCGLHCPGLAELFAPRMRL
jgi:hypothetical protein